MNAPRRANHAGPAGVMLRVLVALLFAFYVGYTQFHLLSELHLDDWLASTHAAAVQTDHHDHDGGDHDGHDNHHVPHPASDHDIQILPKCETFFLALVLLPTASGLVREAPEPPAAVLFLERIKPPGESPPDPLRPRAPPLA